MRKRKNVKIKYVAPVLTDWDRMFMAYHEAGHAVCSYYLPEREPLICVTIDPSSESFGMIRTESRPHHNETDISFYSMIATFLAGQISEEMFLNTKTTSCIYDLSSARKIATDMVMKFGMGETSGISALNPNEYPHIAESTKETLDKDIRKILSNAENQARDILKEHQLEVKKIAEMLLRYGTLNKSDIINLFQRLHHEKRD